MGVLGFLGESDGFSSFLLFFCFGSIWVWVLVDFWAVEIRALDAFLRKISPFAAIPQEFLGVPVSIYVLFVFCKLTSFGISAAMAGVAPEGSAFDSRQYDARMSEM